MSNEKVNIEQFDCWIEDDSNVAALVMRQLLESVEGRDAVVFPPTFAKPEGVPRNQWTGYNIDRFDDGTNVCQLDSVGSQTNRMEPIFKEDAYKHLVPQIVVRVPRKTGHVDVHILDAGHRAADAVIRFAAQADNGSDDSVWLGEKLYEAFDAWQRHGDAEPLARFAPTSCIFGAWDSRSTQAKLPRIVRSVVRAYNVRELTRSAQYNPPLHYVNEGVIEEKYDKGEGDKNPLSQEGFRDNPATGTHGGVEVRGEIRRDAIINLVALRNLGVVSTNGDISEDLDHRTLELRRYILGLSLVALTLRNAQMFNLREGCLLRVSEPDTWEVKLFEGAGVPIAISHDVALAYATETANAFGVQSFDQPFEFDKKKANEWMSKDEKQRDTLRREGAIVRQGS